MVNVIYSLGTIWISDSPPNTTWDYWTPSRLIQFLLTNIFVLFGHLELNSFEILCFDTLRPPRPIHWILGIVSLKFEKVSNSKINIFWNIFISLCFSLLPFISLCYPLLPPAPSSHSLDIGHCVHLLCPSPVSGTFKQLLPQPLPIY